MIGIVQLENNLCGTKIMLESILYKLKSLPRKEVVAFFERFNVVRLRDLKQEQLYDADEYLSGVCRRYKV